MREVTGEKSEGAGPKLVFVYNADSGVFNTLADAAHKIFSPRTYACNLCALTHTAVRMRGEWREFLDGLGLPLEFLHADEFEARYGPKGVRLPSVFTEDGRGLSVLAGADSIDACRTLDDLKRLIAEGLTRGEAPGRGNISGDMR
ncbi:MAG TPA: hypothetical protein VF570_02595 [Pyrinomonadaceae bacterium]